MNELYEPLIERDAAAIDPACRAYAAEHGDDELYLAVARFAVLAYAPSQQSKRAVLACRALYEVRDELEPRWIDWIVAAARYAAESRQPWSEPPILDPPDVNGSGTSDVDALLEAVASGDRTRGERWLAARLHDPALAGELLSIARGDALLMTAAAAELVPILGEKGRYALYRMPVEELFAGDAPETPHEVASAVRAAIAAKGSVESVYPVLLFDAAHGGPMGPPIDGAPLLAPYRLARDYAQTLLARAAARRLQSRFDAPWRDFLAAVEENRVHGEDFSEWSFA